MKKVDDIMELHERFFQVKFSSDEAMEIVLKRSPWTCKGNMFSLLAYDSEKGLDDYSFDTMVVWVRIYNLPFGSMTRSMGMALGGCIGSVMVVDIRLVGGNLGEFLRVRVEIDINQPLRRCVFLDSGKSGKPCVCPLKYEHLPKFCYKCGIIVHNTLLCFVKVDEKASKLPYGDWLKVSV
ncbi:hypothetical protein F3Y22_tig00001509pilonHSYRG00030 [Hibiscus syriacus]|uniref:DUF4283 domain-containing protein n=1 Tax=Hibiscus syriacus TaxID=106335 RepID=A0A6A3CXB4_HIBSY|nr:hypothetical protein F3Y22_tig00001509pilonHSYRG00030 [Hibiscus syriacus]